MATPTGVIGRTAGVNATVGTTTLNPTSSVADVSSGVPSQAIQAGDTLFAVSVWSVGSSQNTVTPDAGWTSVVAQTVVGSMTFSVYMRDHEGGATYDWTIGSGSNPPKIRMFWVRGATAAGFQLGEFRARTVSGAGSSVANIASTLSTSYGDMTAYCLSFERTTATESESQITVSGFINSSTWTQATDDSDVSLNVSYKPMESPGATGPVTITYPNVQANNGYSGIIALKPSEPVETPPTGVIETAFIPNFTNSLLTVGATILQGGEFSIRVSKSAGLSSYTDFAGTVSNNNFATATATGLDSGSKYYIGLLVDGVLQTDYQLSGHTTGYGPGSYTAIAGSCQKTGSNHESIARMATEGALFLCHMGDIHYADATTSSAWISGMRSSLSTTNQKALMKDVPMSYIWDNHDRIIVDTLNTGTTDPQTVSLYRQLAGTNWPSADGMYSTWSTGGVRFIHTDPWTLRDDPDNISDTNYKSFVMNGTPGADVATGGTLQFTTVNRDGGVIKYKDPEGIKFEGDADGGFCIARGTSDAAHNSHSYWMDFSIPELPTSELMVGYVRNSVNDTPTVRLVVNSSGRLFIRDSVNTNTGSTTSWILTPGTRYVVKLILKGGSTTAGEITAKLFNQATGVLIGQVNTTTANLTANSINGFDIGLASQNALAKVDWYEIRVKSNRLTEIMSPAPPLTMFGEDQKDWLKTTMLNATEPMIVWFCSFPNHNASNGRWNSFPLEVEELGAWANSNPYVKHRLVMIGGDSHDLRADSGTRTVGRPEDGSPSHNFIGVPSLNVSGIDQGSDTLWDTGNWDIAQAVTGADSGSYSRLTWDYTRFPDTVDLLWEAVDGSTGDVLAEYRRAGSLPHVRVFQSGTFVDSPAVIGFKTDDPREIVQASMKITGEGFGNAFGEGQFGSGFFGG